MLSVAIRPVLGFAVLRHLAAGLGRFISGHAFKSSLASQSRSFLAYQIGARGFGGRHALTISPRQLKEVIQWHIQTLVRSRLWARWLVARFIVSRYLVLARRP
jgi:hypothetical protein